MSRRKIYSISVLTVVAFFIWIFSSQIERAEDFSGQVKVALRVVGNQLLLSNKDSTSLVLPVIELDESKYQLSFQNKLSLTPDHLVSVIDESFQASGLPNYYRVEIIQNSDQEIAYSYEIKNGLENSLIPCLSREMSHNAYTLQVKFTEMEPSLLSQKALLLAPAIASLLLFAIPSYKRKKPVKEREIHRNSTSLGRFEFYPTQNKLMKGSLEIPLSKKECELLQIFSSKPNQIITRDELTKRVWEDHGVFVGRSLDTFISKLRMILKEDKTIKLTNVHGVGYKLELGEFPIPGKKEA
ncbi:transcriptional regulator [Algoriphagus boseongensis]|uniref:Transcriptional regulator n=2 Tax=Algoriphagus boseongensis TaxID=1442587 RepID=A0A4R6T5Q7_9BACT|nr:transcriptional regulator [Algoriphagus boseongensis]